MDILDKLKMVKDDPMWADHSEISKKTLGEAIDEIEQLRTQAKRHEAVPFDIEEYLSTYECRAEDGGLAKLTSSDRHLLQDFANGLPLYTAPPAQAVIDAPCSKCGYNGPGYYQPETHKCVQAVSVHDDAIKRLLAVAEWLHTSVQKQQSSFDEPPDFATNFDYQLAMAACELDQIAVALAAAPQPECSEGTQGQPK